MGRLFGPFGGAKVLKLRPQGEQIVQREGLNETFLEPVLVHAHFLDFDTTIEWNHSFRWSEDIKNIIKYVIWGTTG